MALPGAPVIFGVLLFGRHVRRQRGRRHGWCACDCLLSIRDYRIFRSVESVFFALLKLIMSLIVSEVKVASCYMMSLQQVLDSTMESRFLHAPRWCGQTVPKRGIEAGLDEEIQRPGPRSFPYGAS